jgi:putative ABC transport system substrate-binding protein
MNIDARSIGIAVARPISVKKTACFLLLCILFGALIATGWAQSPTRLPKIGILAPGAATNTDCAADVIGSNVRCFLDGLRALGYIEGKNVIIEYRYADEHYERLPALAAELVSRAPDVIFTNTSAGAEAAAKATTTIPIVVGPAGEATIAGLAGNLARPTGNVTGIALNISEQDQKCVQLLKELAPRTTKVALLVNPDNVAWRRYPEALEPAAARLGVTLIRIEVKHASDLPQAFAAIAASGANAIFLVDDALIVAAPDVRGQILEWALNRRLPVASSSWRIAPSGGLVSLGSEVPPLIRRAATYVDKILKGARPADLPVERPSVFKLAINLKTAKALGLTIPQSLLLRADEVIQ